MVALSCVYLPHVTITSQPHFLGGGALRKVYDFPEATGTEGSRTGLEHRRADFSHSTRHSMGFLGPGTCPSL